jgi:hypothetical protein
VDPVLAQVARDAARAAVRETHDEIAQRIYRVAPEYLTPEMAAEYLSVSVETLKGWRMAGNGPRLASTRHKFVRYRRADIDAWMVIQAASRD